MASKISTDTVSFDAGTWNRVDSGQLNPASLDLFFVSSTVLNQIARSIPSFRVQVLNTLKLFRKLGPVRKPVRMSRPTDGFNYHLYLHAVRANAPDP